MRGAHRWRGCTCGETKNGNRQKESTGRVRRDGHGLGHCFPRQSGQSPGDPPDSCMHASMALRLLPPRALPPAWPARLPAQPQTSAAELPCPGWPCWAAGGGRSLRCPAHRQSGGGGWGGVQEGAGLRQQRCSGGSAGLQAGWQWWLLEVCRAAGCCKALVPAALQSSGCLPPALPGYRASSIPGAALLTRTRRSHLFDLLLQVAELALQAVDHVHALVRALSRRPQFRGRRQVALQADLRGGRGRGGGRRQATTRLPLCGCSPAEARRRRQHAATNMPNPPACSHAPPGRQRGAAAPCRPPPHPPRAAARRRRWARCCCPQRR